MLGEDALQLQRIDVHPAPVDHLLDPPDQGHVAVGVDGRHVPGMEPAFRPQRPPGLHRRLRVAEVAGARRRAADPELARLAGGKRAPLAVDDAYLAAVHHPADRGTAADFLGVVDPDLAERARFHRAAGLDHRAAEPFFRRFDHRRRQIGRAGADHAQRGGVVVREQRRVREPGEDGGRGMDRAHPLAFDRR